MSHAGVLTGPPSPSHLSQIKSDDVLLLVVNWLNDHKHTKALDALKSECPAAAALVPRPFKSLSGILSEYVSLKQEDIRRKQIRDQPQCAAVLTKTMKNLETLLDDYVSFRTAQTQSIIPSPPRLSPKSPRTVTPPPLSSSPPTASISNSAGIVPTPTSSSPATTTTKTVASLKQTHQATSRPSAIPLPPFRSPSSHTIPTFPKFPSFFTTTNTGTMAIVTATSPFPELQQNLALLPSSPTSTASSGSLLAKEPPHQLLHQPQQTLQQQKQQTQIQKEHGEPKKRKKDTDGNPVKKRLKFENEYDNMGVLLESTELLLDDPSLQEKLASSINQHLRGTDSGLMEEETVNAILDSFLDDPTVNIFTSPEKRKPHLSRSQSVPASSTKTNSFTPSTFTTSCPTSRSSSHSSSPLFSPFLKHTPAGPSENMVAFMKYPPLSPIRSRAYLGINKLKSPKRRRTTTESKNDGKTTTQIPEQEKQLDQLQQPQQTVQQRNDTKMGLTNESEIDKFLAQLQYA